MKKEYLAPDLELVLFESTEDMMDDVTESGGEDPFNGGRARTTFQQWLKDLPNGYMPSEKEIEQFNNK